MASIAGVANGPVSWGISEHDLEGPALDYDDVLSQMAACEYTGTELGDFGFLPTDPEELLTTLMDHDLTMVGGFAPIVMSEPDVERDGTTEALHIAHLLADVSGSEAPVLIVSDEPCRSATRAQYAGRVEPEHVLSIEQWEHAARMVNELAMRVFDDTGLRTVFHPHCATYVETPPEVEIFLDATHPHVVGLCVDTAHYAYGGGDPLRMVEHYGERVWHVHFKGFDPIVGIQAREQGWDYLTAVREGVFCELERSPIQFAAILEALEEIDYRGWITVEQDVLPGSGTPEESAKRNREFLKGIGI